MHPDRGSHNRQSSAFLTLGQERLTGTHETYDILHKGVRKPSRCLMIQCITQTNGSVDPNTNTTSAAFTAPGDGTSLLESFKCGTPLRVTSDLLLYTDSRCAAEILQCSEFKDNEQVTSSVVGLVQMPRQQGRQVIINWIPTHTGIDGNDQVTLLPGLLREIDLLR